VSGIPFRLRDLRASEVRPTPPREPAPTATEAPIEADRRKLPFEAVNDPSLDELFLAWDAFSSGTACGGVPTWATPCGATVLPVGPEGSDASWATAASGAGGHRSDSYPAPESLEPLRRGSKFFRRKSSA
jgi:hypothetical protein